MTNRKKNPINSKLSAMHTNFLTDWHNDQLPDMYTIQKMKSFNIIFWPNIADIDID